MVKHLTHFEDLLFTHGSSIYNRIAKAIYEGEAHYSIKWDGAPAVVVGNNGYYGGEFVSSKSFHNSYPLVWTPETIHKVEDEGLREKLSAVLYAALGHIPPGAIWQGDLLFHEPHSLSHIDWLIKPNVVSYKIPPDRAHGTKVGVVFHTPLSKGAAKISSPHIYDPGHELQLHTVPISRRLDELNVKPAYDPSFMEQYMNWCVKNSQPFDMSPTQARRFHVEKSTKHISGLKSERGVSDATKRWADHWRYLNVDWDARQRAMEHILHWKADLIHSLNHQTAMQTGVAAHVAGHDIHEGFVVTIPHGNQQLQFKLVDRRIFSAANFEAHK